MYRIKERSYQKIVRVKYKIFCIMQYFQEIYKGILVIHEQLKEN